MQSTKEEDPFIVGKANVLKKGKDVTIITCGIMVYQTLLAKQILNKKGIDATIINLHTIKPIDAETIINSASQTRAVVTCEEHLTTGGMGSAVAELLATRFPVPIEMVGVRDRFGESGDAWELMKKFNLMPEDIAAACERAIKRKQ